MEAKLISPPSYTKKDVTINIQSQQPYVTMHTKMVQEDNEEHKEQSQNLVQNWKWKTVGIQKRLNFLSCNVYKTEATLKDSIKIWKAFTIHCKPPHDTDELNTSISNELDHSNLSLPAVTSSTARFSSALEVSISSSLSLCVSCLVFLTGGSHGWRASMSILHSQTHSCPLRLTVVMSKDPFSNKHATIESVWLPKEYVLKLANFSRLYSLTVISFDPTARILSETWF